MFWETENIFSDGKLWPCLQARASTSRPGCDWRGLLGVYIYTVTWPWAQHSYCQHHHHHTTNQNSQSKLIFSESLKVGSKVVSKFRLTSFNWLAKFWFCDLEYRDIFVKSNADICVVFRNNDLFSIECKRKVIVPFSWYLYLCVCTVQSLVLFEEINCY